MTEKLYYADSFIKDFSARVVSCQEENGRFAAVLDRTAFFPEGGGQGADPGTLGGIEVLDVQERGDKVVHYLPSPIDAGAVISGSINWPERLRRMQNHTGEHIVSGTIHRLFGYSNSGFHMDARGCTFDFDGELSAHDAQRVELEANEAVWADIGIVTSFPSPGELAAMEYRSKKELDGQVRIVEITGVDRCACCAPHVKTTGQVGLIKFVDVMKHRGGTRISAVCGADALRDYILRCENISAVSHALSAKPLETGDAVLRLRGEYEDKKRENSALGRELAVCKAALLPVSDAAYCLFEPSLDMTSLRELVNLGMDKCRVCAAFSGTDGDYKYIIGSRHIDLRAASGEINAAISGQGGGAPTMIQGTSRAARGEIEAFFSRFAQ